MNSGIVQPFKPHHLPNSRLNYGIHCKSSTTTIRNDLFFTRIWICCSLDLVLLPTVLFLLYCYNLFCFYSIKMCRRWFPQQIWWNFRNCFFNFKNARWNLPPPSRFYIFFSSFLRNFEQKNLQFFVRFTRLKKHVHFYSRTSCYV